MSRAQHLILIVWNEYFRSDHVSAGSKPAVPFGWVVNPPLLPKSYTSVRANGSHNTSIPFVRVSQGITTPCSDIS